jgi:hypothetical protein
VQGDWQPPAPPGAAGDPSPFNVTTSILGLASLTGKRAPPYWKFTWERGVDPGCTGVTATGYITLNEDALFTCFTTAGPPVFLGATGAGFSFSPNPVYSYSPPATGTVAGSGFSYSYGMPLVKYYSMDGTLVAQETATYVAPDGTSIKIPGFNASTSVAGTYVGFISNAGPNGTWNDAGTGAVHVLTPSVTIIGSERNQNRTYYDGGPIAVIVNGFKKTLMDGGLDTPSTIVTSLSSLFNSDSASPVIASAAGNTLWFSSKSTSTTSLVIAAGLGSDGSPHYTPTAVGSFLLLPSESVMGTGSVTIVGSEVGSGSSWDTGTISVTANGFTESVNYGR